MTSDEQQDLTEALGMAQRLGALGAAPISETIEHATAFTRLLGDTSGTVLDLGSGGGIPGLVIAMQRPDLSLILLDRRQQRTDLCRRLVARLGLEDRVGVMDVDARDVIRRGSVPPVDAVVARGFGAPEVTAECAVPLLVPGGLLAVSEPPAGDRWDETLRARFDLQFVEEIHSPAHIVSLRAGRSSR